MKRSLRLLAGVFAASVHFGGVFAQSNTPSGAVIQPRTDGVVQLDARLATIHGKTARLVTQNGVDAISAWSNPADYVSWQVSLGKSGDYVVEMSYACAFRSQGSTFDIEAGAQKLSSRVTDNTDSWNDYELVKLGEIKKLAVGVQALTLKPTRKQGEAVMSLAWVRLIPTGDYADYLVRTAKEHQPKPVPLPSKLFIVPNYHPASSGWLVNWSLERNYCANNYLNHLDRVRDDANYSFALSECNNMIAILNFQPERFAELRRRVGEGRVEPVNAFFLEPTIGLSGGEALAKMGIEGIRWQEKMLGMRPRYCWAIDTSGIHDQMPQLCAQLGLDALLYIRCSRAEKQAFWSLSPDGSRILTLTNPAYANNIAGLWTTKPPMNPRQIRGVAKAVSSLLPKAPAGAPLLILGGFGDYSPPPLRQENPSDFIQAWKSLKTECDVRFTGLSPYVDTLMAGVKSGSVDLTAIRAGTEYAYGAFWINGPRMKAWYRRDEHALQSAEILATAASLKAGYEYPVQPFYHAWLQMLLNMDRNSLWCAAAGIVFEDPTSWDVKDRLEWVERQSASTVESAARRLAGEGQGMTLFNPANWKRTDPLRLKLPADTALAGAVCETAGDGTTFCQMELPATGIVGAELKPVAAAAPVKISLPATIETKFYAVKIDPVTGALVSLKSKPSGREMLGGPANVIVMDKQAPRGSGNYTNARPKRQRLASSSDFKTTVTATEGPLAITVEARGEFAGGGTARRTVRFFKNHPRIEFDTELNDIPNPTVVFAEFPLAQVPAEIRRGIPFGFSRDEEFAKGIKPAVRWTDYASPGKGGLALLDRGLPGREINDQTPILYLVNAVEKHSGYYNAWTDGKGRHQLEYALVAHDEDWGAARVPQLAWEYNCPVTVAENCQPAPAQSFVQTSDNVIVEAMRREGADIELRLVECTGTAGTAEVTLNLPHEGAALTDLLGKNARKLAGGPTYRFPVQPQQIVTLRCKTAQPVANVVVLTKWDELVPEAKRAALNLYNPDLKGHPPHLD